MIMNELVKTRLACIGYIVQDDDIPLIEYIEQSTKQYIKNFCNVDTLPLGLTYAFVNAVCGEFLYQKKSVGGLGDTFDFGTAIEAAIKTIQEGDTNVTLNTEASPEAQFDSLINTMRTIDISLLVKYRKLVW